EEDPSRGPLLLAGLVQQPPQEPPQASREVSARQCCVREPRSPRTKTVRLSSYRGPGVRHATRGTTPGVGSVPSCPTYGAAARGRRTPPRRQPPPNPWTAAWGGGAPGWDRRGLDTSA